ncbi:MAG: CBS domain-containing protein [Deltaproteobacteria bacterium]|nr:CBS domain-containing protein [Deltaproteobacteria bacterium]MBW2394280.1 CBS domain-containing protein [Deltaproteobacteria bacterium]
MRSAEEYESTAVTVRPNADVREIADEMDAHAVGSVVVVDSDGSPIGIVTDRDLVLRVVAAGRDPEKTEASDVMSSPVFTANRRTPTVELLGMLEERGVRRVPLLEGGKLVGLVSLDDLVMELGVQCWNISEAVSSEIREAARSARGRRRREARRETLDDVRHGLSNAGGHLRKRVVGELRDLLDRIDD